MAKATATLPDYSLADYRRAIRNGPYACDHCYRPIESAYGEASND
jgi:hypothetical protein